MTRHSKLLALFSLVAAGAFVATASSQDKDREGGAPPKPEMSAEQMAQMQEYLKLNMPGEAHEHLEYFVGDWRTHSKMYMAGPGTPPMESEGKSEVRWILGKRFIEERHFGSMMGQAYEGRGIFGYDNFRSMYTSTWTSNMGTQVLVMQGPRDPSGKTWTMYGEMDEPGLVIGRMVKYVKRIISKDKFVFEMTDLHAGEDYKVVEITYERVK